MTRLPAKPARPIKAPKPGKRLLGGGAGTMPEWVAGVAFTSPWIIGFLGFMALPIVLSLYYSLTDYSMLEPPLFVGLDNYSRMLSDNVFWTVMRNTVLYAVVAIPVGTVLALVIAALLNTNMRGQTFYRAAVFLPTLVPLVAAAMIWMWLFNGELGLINTIIEWFDWIKFPAFENGAFVGWAPLRGPNWLGDASWAMTALIIMSFWGVGRAVVIYLAALQDVPQSLYEAADLDGMGRVGKFLNVTVPMVSPVILFNVIMSIIETWQVFAVPYIMTQGGPDRSTYFYTMYLYDNAFPFGQMGYASALAWVQLIIILALTALTFIISKRFVHYRV